MEPTEVSTTTSTTIPMTISATNSTLLPLKTTKFDNDLQRGRNPGWTYPDWPGFTMNLPGQQIYNYKYTREVIHKVTHKIISSKARPSSPNPKCGRIRKIINFTRTNLYGIPLVQE